jgi:hypothetical protein
MTVYVGPTNWWWRENPDSDIGCKVKGTLNDFGLGGALLDGSTIMCASNGVAILVAPSCTQVCSAWAGGQYNTTQVGDKCCISEWSGLQTALTNAGFTPSDWFVPSYPQLQLGYQCKDNWDSTDLAFYWSSKEYAASCACNVNFNSSCSGNCITKSIAQNRVRAFRCVTY